MSAQITRTIHQLLGSKVDRRHAFQDLLISNCRRTRRAPHVVDHALDSRSIDHLEPLDFLSRSPQRSMIVRRSRQRNRVDDQQLLDDHADPVVEVMLAVRTMKKVRELVDAIDNWLSAFSFQPAPFWELGRESDWPKADRREPTAFSRNDQGILLTWSFLVSMAMRTRSRESARSRIC